MFRHTLLAAALLAASFVSANAGVITKRVDFSISGVGPISPVAGSFTVSLDPTLTYADQTAGLVMNSLNLTVGSPIAFDYFPNSQILGIGGTQNGNNGIAGGTYDFLLGLTNLFTAPQFMTLGYVQGDFFPFVGGLALPGVTAQVSVKDVEVPEPVTLSLFGAGFAGLMAVRRKGKKA